MTEHQLILSLGGNLGNKAQIFRDTSEMIECKIGRIVSASPVYETPPWGFESNDPFWNQVLQVSTCLLPDLVLTEIRMIEEHFGRERKQGVYLSRMMDIDILFYDDLILNTDELTVPHAHIAMRRFVLAPLADIAPGLVHPGTGKTVLNMLEECIDTSEIKKVT